VADPIRRLIGALGPGSPDPEPCEGTAANGLPRESVWDYPRPPRVEGEPRVVTVHLGGELIATTDRALRVCETAGPPAVYLPPDAPAEAALIPVRGGSWCEWKGQARYFEVRAGARRIGRAAWSYPSPKPGYEVLAGWLSFYPGRLECRLGEELVRPQPGGFYGGWVTDEICGPFKGGPGTLGW
jgi:uncharacterized protein (DUF427 family)